MIIDLPYVIAAKKKNGDYEMKEWCRQNVGQERTWEVATGEWACFWSGGHPNYLTDQYNWLFKNEQDAIMFALRWT